MSKLYMFDIRYLVQDSNWDKFYEAQDEGVNCIVVNGNRWYLEPENSEMKLNFYKPDVNDVVFANLQDDGYTEIRYFGPDGEEELVADRLEDEGIILKMR